MIRDYKKFVEYAKTRGIDLEMLLGKEYEECEKPYNDCYDFLHNLYPHYKNFSLNIKSPLEVKDNNIISIYVYENVIRFNTTNRGIIDMPYDKEFCEQLVEKMLSCSYTVSY